jgi:hypothetical protein
VVGIVVVGMVDMDMVGTAVDMAVMDGMVVVVMEWVGMVDMEDTVTTMVVMEWEDMVVMEWEDTVVMEWEDTEDTAADTVDTDVDMVDTDLVTLT